MKWNNNSYLDVSIPMGLKTGIVLFQCTTNCLHHKLKSKNVDVHNHIDNIILHKECDATAEFNMMYSLFEFLGIPINTKKVPHVHGDCH